MDTLLKPQINCNKTERLSSTFTRTIFWLQLLVSDLSLTILLCPTEEKFGMLMSLVIINVHVCGGVGGKMGYWGSGKGLKNGAVVPEHGTGMGRSSHAHTKGYHVE
jgi:hypothetical protein